MAAWFSILDRWGARERKHPETVAYLIDEHHVPGWWAQSITVSYQRDRGMRLKHQQADGFTIYASVAHEKLPDADEAETMKLFWRERLSDLKYFIES